MEYSVGGTWGNAIQWSDWDSRRVVGWKSRKPVVGDILKSTMGSGKVAVFEFTAVEYKDSPSDMFFGTVRDIGYDGELPAPDLEREANGHLFVG